MDFNQINYRGTELAKSNANSIEDRNELHRSIKSKLDYLAQNHLGHY